MQTIIDSFTDSREIGDMKILIKGAGDLATGIAYRLKLAGHRILMTECLVPTTVRRTVAFSRAVYEGYAEVENIKAVYIKKSPGILADIEEVQNDDCIAVIVDEECNIREQYSPEIVIDAIIAKRNINTRITDAPFVIGVGPGFTTGVDCHAIIETKRGHTLGRVIRQGSAIANTGIPGEIGGYSVQRIIRASADGIFNPCVAIGDRVDSGDLVAFVIDGDGNRRDVFASIPGIVRGMLQKGVCVTSGMKAGDIDPRAEREYCFSISDKALAIAGGALEAVCRYESRKDNITIILLAAGNSERFGRNKLLELIEDKPMIEYALEKYANIGCYNRIVVTQYDEVADIAKRYGYKVVYNTQPDLGISESIKCGLRLQSSVAPIDAVLFSVCDQPYIKEASIIRLITSYAASDKGIACLSYNDEPCNPNIFDRKYIKDLLDLEGDTGGKKIVFKHMDDVEMAKAEAKTELEDIDVPDMFCDRNGG